MVTERPQIDTETADLEFDSAHAGRPAPQPFFLARLAALARSIETKSSAWLAGLAFIYLTTTLARCIKPFWFDEITTYYLARMDSVSIAWRAIRNGGDLQPPLMVVLAHFSQRLLGPNEIATRLPAILGVMVACGCTFAFIRRRSGAVFAICGAVLILLTSAYHYAMEARPYGLVLAGAAIALVSWQSADRPGRSWVSLAGIAAGLWIALASQCYSVLLAIPFGAGEIARSVRRKRIDWPVWVAFGLSASALMFYPPLFRSMNRGFADQFPMFAPNLRSLWIVPSHMVGGAGRVVAAVMVSIALLRRGHRTHDDARLRPPVARNAVPLHETVVVVLLTAMPIFLMILVARLHSPIFYRYALAAVIGMAVLISQAFEHLAGGDSRLGVVVFLLFAGVFVERFVSDAFGVPDFQPQVKLMADTEKSAIQVAGNPLLSMVTGDLPLVVSNPFWFPQVAHYAPPALAARTYYLTDTDAALKFTHTDPYQIALPLMLRLNLPGHVIPYSVFTATHRRFLVYSSSNEFDWLMGRLGPDRATFQFIGRLGDALLLEACLQCEK
ncbi:MAG: glycosyltransferase family 39 protein [Bryobacteraceae bacterium]|jgi:hypothetical protein